MAGGGLFDTPGVAAALVANPSAGRFKWFLDTTLATPVPAVKDSSGTVYQFGGINAEQVMDVVGALLQDTAVIDFTYNDAGDALTATIIANAVTDAMLAQVPTASFKGRTTAGTGNVEVLTATQATALLNLATGALKGLLSAADFSKLAGIAAGATADTIATAAPPNVGSASVLGAVAKYAKEDHTHGFDDTAHGSRGGSALHAVAVNGGANGFLLGTDKTKLDLLAGPDNATLEVGGGVLREKDGGTTNAKLANMVQRTVKGRQITAGTGAPVDLTSAELTANLDPVSTSLQGAMLAADKRKLNSIWKDAVEDGGCSNTGTTDSAPLITALLATFPAGFPGTIYFPAGIYRFDSAVTIAAEGITMLGQGRRTAKLCSASATANIFTVTGDAFLAENLRFSAISGGIDADTAGAPGAPARALRTAGYAVDFGSATDSSGVRKCDILYQWSGIHSQSSLQFFDDLNIREYGANAINGACILIDGAGDRYIKRLTTDNGSNPTGFAGIRVTTCASLVISDSNIIHAGTALALEPPNAATIPSVEAVNTFFDTSVYGLRITTAGTGQVLRCKFTNCWFGTHTTAGIEMNGTQWDGITFDNCDIYGNPIGISCPTGGGTWALVGGSRVAGSSTAGISLTASAGHKPTIANSRIGPVSGFGVNGTGILIAAGVYGGIIISNNDLSGNTTNYTNNATSPTPVIFTNNLPFLPLGSLATLVANSAAITAEAVVFNIPVPANGLTVGTTLRLHLRGATAASGNPTIKVKYGTAGTTADGTVYTTGVLTSGAAQQIDFHVDFTNRAIGAATSWSGITDVVILATTTLIGAAITAGVASTAAGFITITATMSASTITFTHGTLEVLRP